LGKATTPINIDALEVELLCHPDRRFVDNLISGLRHGFYTGITNPPTQPFECTNLLSATKYADDVSLLVNKELEKGYLIGPFIKRPFDIYRVSPIGLWKVNILAKHDLFWTCLLHTTISYIQALMI